MASPFFQVIFRTCDVVNSVHNTPRPFALDKKTLIKICFKSLYDSLQGLPHGILVLGDKLSDEMLSFFSRYPVTLTNGNYGNDESIRQSVEKAVQYPDDYWVYFCEDDYLHRPETFRYISNFIENRETIIPEGKKRFFDKTNYHISKANLVFHPPDYPDRYWPQDREPFYIFHSQDCHWRQIANITFTFMLQVKVIKKYKKVFDVSSTKANDGYLSKTLFRKKYFGNDNLCLSPLPGLSCHMHEGVLTPLVNWEAIVNKYRGDL
ncbi:MAG TPA: hypothetical protein VEY10_06435 [Flavisolibacter sp.]|jgi:hypothetical protein|nr:hypothetical protein [Flavisolibacter sp.]